MEAGNGMPFRLRQLLRVSTSFKMLGKSCKCSSNEIDLSATSKQIPAAPKCLFAVGLNGDCVNRSAFKDTCQEKFRSSIRQWHWNAAFSKTVAYIKPEKKPLPSLFSSPLLPSGLLTFCCLSAWGSLQRLHKQATNGNAFSIGMFEDGLVIGDRILRHSTAPLTSQVPPSWVRLPSAAQVGCGEEGKRHSAEPLKASSMRA